ncbi:MAG: hypothetical protein K8S22_08725 [Betaproteobacteria bacterium]|nr:hypothetical protein [Betaproteobacteria bacterium]
MAIAVKRLQRARWRHVLLLVALLVTGCELLSPSAPGVTEEWAGLLNEIRAFERKLGFSATNNFTALAKEQRESAFCGHASRLTLPYSYEDPAISWLDAPTEQDCRMRGRDADVYFGTVEAWGESASPVTPAMLTSKLDRFIYLVIHEDCHDQFDLPYGIEEALCNLITYKAMAAFTAEKYGYFAREHRVVQRYADTQSGITRATVTYYDQMATLYARYERREIPPEVLLQQRALIFQAAEKPLAWPPGDYNNVRLANHMTYSRHFPLLESVLEKLGRDTARTVAFFKRVDAIKPPRAAVLARHGIADEYGVEAVRAYEAAVVETINAALPEVL